MKKVLFSLLVALTLVFTSCDGICGCNKDVNEFTDSTSVVIDTNMVVEDTIHCVALTKDSVRCKNHRVQGDTLCAIHRKTK